MSFEVTKSRIHTEAREAIALHKRKLVSDEYLRDIVLLAMAHEVDASLNKKMKAKEAKLVRFTARTMKIEGLFEVHDEW